MNLVDDLTRLAELHQSGTLTVAEYTAAKARLISTCPVDAAVPPAHVDQPETPTPLQSVDPPAWMKPWGWFLVWIGALGFGASVYLRWRTDHEQAALMSGLMNPMFFIGMPIGLYWLTRTGEVSRVIFPLVRASVAFALVLLTALTLLALFLSITGR